ncbi:SH3 domain-containing protein [Chryseobacterium oryctis]|uniref:SH3 domain-containing protein n=1 Tax=Chryseobacterium oryctis TaxID=2952618 RepID=A0ABT3HP80_9FLAO|nr:SH3 domain-containing protein [Chryseobacterium oryctis]MCW3161428.1 SH3 domain-containing protein [Chryseobacterium oryctis]
MFTVSELPEVKKQSRYVDSLTSGKKQLSFLVDSLEIKNKPYYTIKTGFNGDLHWETYTIFYVNKNDCNQVLVDDVVSGNILSINEWRNLNKKQTKMNNQNSTETVSFSELFDEGSNIKFGPADLSKNTPEIVAFKSKLTAFESSNPEPTDFSVDDLLLLINNETFSNNERFVNSDWLGYFVNKYPFKRVVTDKLMDAAIAQEDFSAVKILSKNYIFSKKEIEQAKEKKKYKDALNGKLDTEEYYDPAFSKIDQILAFITTSYSKNHIEDQDGFTNLRKDKTTTSEVLQKIKSGEHIEVIDNYGDWFLVKTKEGKEGYVYKTRVKSI